MEDYARYDRQALITGETTPEEKLRRAKAILGERYLCHPVNHVQRCPRRAPEISKTDVSRTWAKFRKQGKDLV